MLASPADMIPIRNNVHFLFCEEVNIVSPGLRFNGYVNSGDLKIDTTQNRPSSHKTALFVGKRSYNYFTFYLLEGSSIHLKHCTERFLSFTVIIGRANFETWKEYQYCDDCYYEQSFLEPAESCSDDDRYGKFSLEARVEDEYFFIYNNDIYMDDWVNLKIEIVHAVFNLQNATTFCTDVTNCNVILDGPSDTAVIWVKDYNYDLGKYNHPEFSVKCVPRIWAYLLIHGFPVLFIGLFLSILIQKTCRDPDSSYNQSTERTPLLYNTAVLPPSYSTVLSEPPKYEDIIRTYEPPSYSEAVAVLETGQSATTYHTHIENEPVLDGSIPSINIQNETNGRHTVYSINSIVASVNEEQMASQSQH